LITSYLPNEATYKSQLEGAGFKIVKFEQVTAHWKEVTWNRVQNFREKWASHLKIHGEETCNGLLFFYSQIEHLFRGGNVGGAVIIAQKPGPATV